MATTIVTKNGSGVPLDTDLVQGELAIDLVNKRIYSKDPSDEIIQLGSDIDIPDGVNEDDMLLWSDADDKWTTSEYVPSTEFSTSPPANPKTGMLWQDTTPDEQALYCWDGTAWFEIVGANGIDGGSGQDAKQIWSEVTSDGDIYYDNGNVGIGTDTAESKLHISGDYYTAGFYRNIDVDNVGAALNWIQLGSKKAGVDTPAATFGGLLESDGLSGSATIGSLSNGTLKEAMRIDADGNVGIRSSSPSGQFECSTGAGTAFFTRSAGDNGSSSSCLAVSTGASTTTIGATNPLTFNVGSTGTAANAQTERMRIDVDGRVDITGSLYVNGTPKIGYSELITTLVTLRNATQDETTLEGLRDSIGNAIGGLIEKFEQEIATMPAEDSE